MKKLLNDGSQNKNQFLVMFDSRVDVSNDGCNDVASPGTICDTHWVMTFSTSLTTVRSETPFFDIHDTPPTGIRLPVFVGYFAGNGQQSAGIKS